MQIIDDIQTFIVLRVSQNINEIVLVENHIGLRKAIIHGVEKPIDVFCCCARKVLIYIFFFKTRSKSRNIIHIMLFRPIRSTIVQCNISWLGWILGAILSYSKRKHMVSHSALRRLKNFSSFIFQYVLWSMERQIVLCICLKSYQFCWKWQFQNIHPTSQNAL